MIEQTSPQTESSQATSTAAPLVEPDPVQRPARLAMYVGAALVVVGLVVLYLGYNGAATNPLPQAQTPYVISGGLLGVALMVLGAITIAMHVLLRVQADFRTDLDRMRESIDRLGDAMSRQSVLGSLTAKPSANGSVMVTRGASSFHRADCRLVARADAARPMPRDDADAAGLTPCRICKP